MAHWVSGGRSSPSSFRPETFRGCGAVTQRRDLDGCEAGSGSGDATRLLHGNYMSIMTITWLLYGLSTWPWPFHVASRHCQFKGALVGASPRPQLCIERPTTRHVAPRDLLPNTWLEERPSAVARMQVNRPGHEKLQPRRCKVFSLCRGRQSWTRAWLLASRGSRQRCQLRITWRRYAHLICRLWRNVTGGRLAPGPSRRVDKLMLPTKAAGVKNWQPVGLNGECNYAFLIYGFLLLLCSHHHDRRFSAS